MHLPAGISHWHLGRFDLYRVNPPLVRAVAALPVLAAAPKVDWRSYDTGPGGSSLMVIGSRFAELNGQRCFWLYTLARWACIPFSLLGGCFCYRWARDLYGEPSGMLALALWCFGPNVLAYGGTMLPDVGAAALGITWGYAFWRYLREPTWSAACLVGLLLGLTELTKLTWIVLFPLWPAITLAWWIGRRRALVLSVFRVAGHFTLILLLSLLVMNAGYGFERSLRRLDSYGFVSEALSGLPHYGLSDLTRGNRFADHWLGRVPVPLPQNYLAGIDEQKSHFEQKDMSYLRGQWRRGGWWYYYLYAVCVKVPLGTLLLVLAAGAACLCRRGYFGRWEDEVVLLAPALAVLTLVSSQTGFSHHLRYVLPMFPFALVWTSRIARVFQGGRSLAGCLVAGCAAWAVASSLWIYPHSYSYFNELVGGPLRGRAHLLGSNLDWGQDVLYLQEWVDRHPEARPLFFPSGLIWIDPGMGSLRAGDPPPWPLSRPARPYDPSRVGPQPGWYILRVNQILDESGEYTYFLGFSPAATVGYSVYIYHVTPDEANRVRRNLGLPELPPGPAVPPHGAGGRRRPRSAAPFTPADGGTGPASKAAG